MYNQTINNTPLKLNKLHINNVFYDSYKVENLLNLVRSDEKPYRVLLSTEEEYSKLADYITKDLFMQTEESFNKIKLFLNDYKKLQDTLPFMEEKEARVAKSSLKNKRPLFEEGYTNALDIFKQYSNLSLYSPHILGASSVDEFIASRENRMLCSELLAFLTAFEVPYIDMDTFNSMEVLTGFEKTLPNLRQALLHQLISTNKTHSFLSFSCQTSNMAKFFAWNNFHIVKAVQNDDLFIFDTKSLKLKHLSEGVIGLIDNYLNTASTNRAWLKKDIVIVEPLDKDFCFYTTGRVKDAKPITKITGLTPSFNVNPNLFNIILREKKEGIKNFNIDEVAENLFSFDYNMYSDKSNKEELKRLFNFNTKSLLMLIPALMRQGEHKSNGSLSSSIRDSRLDNVPTSKRLPVLMGQTHIGKTEFVKGFKKWHFGVKEGFNNELTSADGKASLIKNSILEFAEVSYNNIKSNNIIKSLIGIDTFNLRKYYTQDETTYAFQTLLVATTNDDAFLKDDTGTVRYTILPLAPFQEGKYKGYAINKDYYPTTEDEYYNFMISLQEEFFKCLNELGKDEAPRKEEIKGYFAYNYNFDLCRLSESLIGSKNTYKSSEEMTFEDWFMSKNYYYECLSESEKPLAKKSAELLSLTEIVGKIRTQFLGTLDKPANYNSRKLISILRHLGYKPTRRSVGGIRKRVWVLTFKDGSESDGIIVMDKFKDKLEETKDTREAYVSERRETKEAKDNLSSVAEEIMSFKWNYDLTGSSLNEEQKDYFKALQFKAEENINLITKTLLETKKLFEVMKELHQTGSSVTSVSL